MIEQLYPGRSNLAITVHAPYDCPNNCMFCRSKDFYKCIPPDLDAVEKNLKELCKKTSIKEIVFTGGEIMADKDGFHRLINAVTEDKDIYINTTLLDASLACNGKVVPLDDFTRTINKTMNIKGINVSRHAPTYEKDRALLSDIAADECFENIKVPVRINCVDQNLSADTIVEIVNRYASYKNVSVCFRANFYRISKSELHAPNDLFLMRVPKGYRVVKHSYCIVCDTLYFANDEGLSFSYHRGLPTTLQLYPGYAEVNDVVMFQDGSIYLDWDRDENNLTSIEILAKNFPKSEQTEKKEPKRTGKRKSAQEPADDWTRMKRSEPPRPRFSDEVILCKVSFNGGDRTYTYRTDDDSIRPGDKVLVPVGEKNTERLGEVVDIGYFSPELTPYPLDKIKKVSQKLGYSPPPSWSTASSGKGSITGISGTSSHSVCSGTASISGKFPLYDVKC